VRFEFKSGIVSFYFSLSLFLSENHVCLSRGVQVAGAAWRAVMRIMAGVEDLVQRTEDGRIGWVLDGRRSKGRVAPCAVSTVHGEMRSAGFLVEPQNQGR
jgi:hypothetical protein